MGRCYLHLRWYFLSVITLERTMPGKKHQTKISSQADGAAAVQDPAHPEQQQQPVQRGHQGRRGGVPQEYLGP